jgi:hypothetical protein
MAFVRLFRSRTRRPDFAMETEAAVNFAKATSGRLSSFSNALVEAPERHKPAAYLVSTVCVVYNMAEPEMGRGKHSALIFL